MRDWARREPEVTARLAGVDAYRMDYARAQTHALCPNPREAETRALIAFTAIGMRYATIPM
ncbi:MAG TPA: hypothetical protein VIP77_17080 [Jiangellaceae bacterium]